MDGATQIKEDVQQKYCGAARALAETGNLAACCDPANDYGRKA